MLEFQPPVSLQLHAGQLMKCRHAAWTRLRVVQGCVWITQENDLGDHFLEPGQAMTLLPKAQALLSAEGPAQVVFEAADSGQVSKGPRTYAAGAP